MAARLFPFARAIVDFAVTDTWDPAGTDFRKDEWIGAVYYDYDATNGYVVYRCVKNTSASPLAAAIVVATEDGETNIDHVEPAIATDPAIRVRGVTIGAIAVGHCGFIICKGKASMTAQSAIAANTAIATDAAGAVDDTATGAGDSRFIIGSTFGAVGGAGAMVGYINVL